MMAYRLKETLCQMAHVVAWVATVGVSAIIIISCFAAAGASAEYIYTNLLR